MHQLLNKGIESKILVANGQEVNIKQSGICFIAYNNQNSNLKLKDILHVPKITKHLVSVSRLTFDNNIIVEFDSYGCNVKDMETGRTLLHIIHQEGLYKLNKEQLNCYNTQKVGGSVNE